MWSVDGTKLDPDKLSYPCGLLPKNYPMDTFWFFSGKTGEQINLSTKNIAWHGFEGTKFKSTNKSREWVDVEDERFINWMRPNTLSNVYKAWGRFEQSLIPGEYIVKIYNFQDEARFGGHKYFGFASLTKLGADNSYIPIVLGIISICSMIFTGIFFVINTVLGKDAKFV